MVRAFLLYAIIVAWAAATLGSLAQAQTLDQITELVRKMCVAPDQKGKEWQLTADGKGDVSVKLPVAGQLGAGVEVKFTQGEWDGIRKVLVEKQADENARYRDCVEKVLPQMLQKVKSGEIYLKSQQVATIIHHRAVFAAQYQQAKNAELERGFWISLGDKAYIVESGKTTPTQSIDCDKFGAPYAGVISGDVRTVAAVVCFYSLKLMDISTGKVISLDAGKLNGGPAKTNLLAFSQPYVISKHPSDPCLLVWTVPFENVAQTTLTHKFECERDVQSISVPIGQNYVAIGGRDGTIAIWYLGYDGLKKMYEHQFQFKFKDSSQSIGLRHVRFVDFFTNDGAMKLTAHTWGNAAYLIDIPNWAKVSIKSFIYPVEDAVIFDTRLSPNGRFLVTGTSDGAVTIWDVQNGTVAAQYFHDDMVECVEFGPQNDIVLSASRDKTVRSFRIATKSLIDTISLQREGTALSTNYGRRRFLVGEGGTNEMGDFLVSEWKVTPGGKISAFAN